jgi:parallel beta-helix repeat protein
MLLTSQITDGGSSSIVLEGEGWGTDLVFTSAVSSTAINIYEPNSRFLDFKVDCSAVQDTGHDCVHVSGSGAVISGLYVTGASHGGIDVDGSNIGVYNNWAVANRDDEFIIRGSNVTVTGNHAIHSLTARHNAISLVTVTDSVVSDNVVAYGSSLSYGIALENLGDGPCQRITITGNTIYRSGLAGIVIYPASGGVESADDITIVGNSVYESCWSKNVGTAYSGIVARSGNRITISGNTVSSPYQDGISLFAGVTGSVISNNQIFNSSLGGGTASIVINSPAVVVGNEVLSIGGTGKQAGIKITSTANYTVVSGNKIDGLVGPRIGIYDSGASQVTISSNIISTSSGTGKGIYVDGNAQYVIITANMIRVSQEAVSLQSGDDYIRVTNNDLNATVIVNGVHDVLRGNSGYNPVGEITNFIGTGTIGLLGTTSTVVSGTTYTVTGVDLFITSAGGTRVSIALYDQSGNVVASGMSTLTAQYVPVGWKINWTWSTVPTVTVFGN